MDYVILASALVAIAIFLGILFQHHKDRRGSVLYSILASVVLFTWPWEVGNVTDSFMNDLGMLIIAIFAFAIGLLALVGRIYPSIYVRILGAAAGFGIGAWIVLEMIG